MVVQQPCTTMEGGPYKGRLDGVFYVIPEKDSLVGGWGLRLGPENDGLMGDWIPRVNSEKDGLMGPLRRWHLGMAGPGEVN